MTGTLTLGAPPFQLPKLNSNLLSVVSLILLLTMAFLTASVIAAHCGPEEEAVANATEAAIGASILLGIAIASGNAFAIAAALYAWYQACRAADNAQDVLDKCEAEHYQSGGCS